MHWIGERCIECSKLASVALTLAAVAWTSAAQAQTTIYSDGFEYGDQAAFEAAWPAVSGVSTGTLSTDQAFGGTEAIYFPVTPATTRNQHSITETLGTAANPVLFKFKFYDTAGTSSAYRQFATLLDAAGTGNGQLVSLGLNNNIASSKYMARIVGADGGSGVSAFFQLNGTGSPNRSTGWHELMAAIAPTTIDFYVDGVLSKSVANPTNRSFDSIRIGSGLTAASAAYIDDVYVGVGPVPEPGGLAALGAVAAGLLSRRRRN